MKLRKMKVIGIICEYNPFHLGHAGHIEKTINAVNDDCAVVCVMSGNFVQRGDLAVFNKHARAEVAVRCGADLVVELSVPYVLSSAEGFARAGVHILNSMGLCDFLSFGSESGDVEPLARVAEVLISEEAGAVTRKMLDNGLSYAAARQKAVDEILGSFSKVLTSPNNLLGIEYIIALMLSGSEIKPLTVSRTGGDHDGESPYAASALRKYLVNNNSLWKEFVPTPSLEVLNNEIRAGRGPVSVKQCESAILSRLRLYDNYGNLAGVSEGLEYRFKKYAVREPTIESILEKTKSKRYVMSRLRRMMLNVSLDITDNYIKNPPPYIRVLAMNGKGMKLLRKMQKSCSLPIITKPASVLKFDGFAIDMFNKEAAATDLYVLGYQNEDERYGGREWLQSPSVFNNL